MNVNGGPNLDIATTDTALGVSQAFTYFLNLKQQYWYLYETTGGVFSQTNSGPLLKGAPPAQVPGVRKSSTAPNPKGKLDQMF